MPTASLEGPVLQVPEYVDYATFARALWQQLHRRELVFDGSEPPTFQKSQNRVFQPDVVSVFTEHAERDVLPSPGALVGISKSQRDFLGRWAPEQSEEYTRTARQVVL